MSKVRSLFLKNIWWKLTSLALAILLWLVGMNINNPELTQNFTVDLTFKNSNNIEDTGLVLLNKDSLLNTNVTINIRATKQKLEELKSDKIRAEIDFAPISITSKEYAGLVKPVEIIITLPPGYEYSYYSPRFVDLQFDLYDSREFDVNIIKTGTPAENYDTLSNWKSAPSKVTLSGAKSDLDKISTVAATIDVTGANSAVTEEINLIVYDVDNNVITNLFDFSQESVTVTVPVYMYANIPFNALTWTDTPKSGYEVTDIIVEPSYIEVFGSADDISSLPSINLEAASVNGATANVTNSFKINDLLTGSNLNKKNGTADEVTVTYVVKPMMVKTLSVPIDNFTLQNLSDEIELPTTINVKVSGSSSLVNSVTTSQITGLIDFSTYNSETGEIKITALDYPSGLSVSLPITLNLNTVESAEDNEDDMDIPTTDTIDNPTETEDIDTGFTNEDVDVVTDDFIDISNTETEENIND